MNTVLSWWWMATPLVFLTPAIAFALGAPQVREEMGWMFALAALISAVAAPAMGIVLAHVGRRPQARRRFTIMGAVSSALVLFFWVFGVLLAECPDGYHC
ncbi:hypothetical protein AB0L71_13025 [Streptomyces sp. NPDC052052]|uniref:hypothetical protein n=1 Tax=Streptomyces sp. NPDC052052 TaxID=3154756 RepID=UPI00341CB590